LNVIRLLNNGDWSKPPVLTAARRILIDGLIGKWPKTELGSLATFLNGTSYDRALLDDSGGTPIIRISNMTNPQSDYLTTSQSFDDKYIVRPDDLLVSWSASFKSAIWPGPIGVLNQHIFKVTEKPGNHRGFIRHAIEAVFNDMQSKVVGIGMMHLRRRDFLGYEVPVPDFDTQEAVCRFLDWIESPNGQPEPTLPAQLSEQRRIVARIEELAARIEEARGLRQQAVAEAKILVDAELDNAFTPISKKVEALVVGSEGGFVTSGPRGWGKYYDEGGDRRLIRVENVWNRELDLSTAAKVELPDQAGDIKRSEVEAGDVLVTITGAIGRVGVVRKFDLPCHVSQHVALVRPPKSVDPDYLYWFLQSPSLGRPQTEGQTYGATKPGINLTSLRKLRIPALPLSKQREMASYFSKLQTKIDSLKQLQAATAAELDALLPSVLDLAFKGNL
jgi:type I restriction enzyme S subunit